MTRECHVRFCVVTGLLAGATTNTQSLDAGQ